MAPACGEAAGRYGRQRSGACAHGLVGWLGSGLLITQKARGAPDCASLHPGTVLLAPSVTHSLSGATGTIVAAAGGPPWAGVPARSTGRVRGSGGKRFM